MTIAHTNFQLNQINDVLKHYHFFILYNSMITLIIFIVLCHKDLRRGYILSWLSPLFLISILLNILYFH